MHWRSRISPASNAISASKTLFFGAFVCLTLASPLTATAQKAPENANKPDFAPAMIEHMQKMRRYKDPDRGAEHIPPVIDHFSVDRDPHGVIASFQPNGATITANNAFFKDMGTNGRSCFTCHRPENGWSVTPADIAERFEKSRGTDPIFRLVDGATCPSDNVSTLRAKRHACSNNPAIGTSGILSMYRRPLPVANIKFLSTVMWDGRESVSDLNTNLTNQAVDATLGHAQAAIPPTPAQAQEIVDFEMGLFTAQIFDRKAKFLTGDNAKGGPVALSMQDFFIGVNDPLGLNPKGIPFTSQIFDLYRPWLSAGERHDHDDLRQSMGNEQLFRNVNATDDWRRDDHERGMVSEHRRSVARGEEVFNNTQINITGVAGLNDDLNTPSISGFCGTCHDAPNIGHHSVKAPLDIGIPDAGDKKPPVLDISGLPVFTLTCTQGPLAGQVYKVRSE